MNTGELIKVKETLLSPEFHNELQQINLSSRFKLNLAAQCFFAKDIIESNTYLQSCTPESIIKAVKDVATLGISLNPKLQQGYLVPRNKICCLDVSYMGCISLMYELKIAREVFANAIYEGDIFDFDFVLNKVVKYIPYHMQKGKQKGDEIGVFACAVDFEGYARYVYMPISRVMEIAESSEAFKSAMAKKKKNEFYYTIWETSSRGEMIKKTAIRALWKMLPKGESSAEFGAIMSLHDEANALTESSFTEKGDEVQTHSVKASENRVTNANSKMKPIIPKNKQKVAEAEIVPEKTPVHEIKDGVNNTEYISANAKEVTTDTVIIDPNAKDEILSTFTENYSLGDRSTRTSGEVAEMFEILEERGFKRDLIEERVAKGSKSFKTAEELLLKGQEEQIGAVLGKILEVQAAQQQELFSPGK